MSQLLSSIKERILQNYYVYRANELVYDTDFYYYRYSSVMKKIIKLKKSYDEYVSKISPENRDHVHGFYYDMNKLFIKVIMYVDGVECFDLLLESGLINVNNFSFISSLISYHPDGEDEMCRHIYKLKKLIHKLQASGYLFSPSENKKIIKSLRPFSNCVFPLESVKNIILNTLKLESFNGTKFLFYCFLHIDDPVVLESYVDFVLNKSIIYFNSYQLFPEMKYPSVAKKVIVKMVELEGKDKAINILDRYGIVKNVKNKIKKNEKLVSHLNEKNLLRPDKLASYLDEKDLAEWRDYHDYLVSLVSTN